MLWQQARSELRDSDSAALKAVLSLPLDEANRSLALIPQTQDPITAISEQVTLVHLNDLFSRLFIQLVDATTTSSGVATPASVISLANNLRAKHLGKTLSISSFDREIKSVIQGLPKGSAANALGLVLIGLWGVFTGPTPSAQAALASALAAEELQGSGTALQSVSAMLELLYPRSSTPQRPIVAILPPQNALALDKLALVCIDYVRLLSTAHQVNQQETRLKRLEVSQKVQKATIQLRLDLTQTRFVGLDDQDLVDRADGLEDEERSFERAKEKLVGVLSVIGRRAAGRSFGRDEDSGLEDLEEQSDT